MRKRTARIGCLRHTGISFVHPVNRYPGPRVASGYGHSGRHVSIFAVDETPNLVALNLRQREASTIFHPSALRTPHQSRAMRVRPFAWQSPSCGIVDRIELPSTKHATMRVRSLIVDGYSFATVRTRRKPSSFSRLAAGELVLPAFCFRLAPLSVSAKQAVAIQSPRVLSSIGILRSWLWQVKGGIQFG